MAFVRVEQRNAHLAGAVRLNSVEGRDGPISKATLTAISNTRRGGRGEGDNRGEESTAIQWTLWGKQAENAAEYLGKGSHVNIVGRLRNNNYEKDGEEVYALAFTCEEIDYLGSKADAEARRTRTRPEGAAGGEGQTLAPTKANSRSSKGRAEPQSTEATLV